MLFRSERILAFVMARAKGEIPTGARFIRDLVLQNPCYMKDSIVSEEVNNELIKQIVRLNLTDPSIQDQETCSESSSAGEIDPNKPE